MLFFIAAAGTLLSTFMAADALSQAFALQQVRVALFMLMLWLLAIFLSPWMGSVETLGWAHCAVFLAAAVKYGEDCLSHDFIRIPLVTYVPVFGTVNILVNYAWPSK